MREWVSCAYLGLFLLSCVFTGINDAFLEDTRCQPGIASYFFVYPIRHIVCQNLQFLYWLRLHMHLVFLLAIGWYVHTWFSFCFPLETAQYFRENFLLAPFCSMVDYFEDEKNHSSHLLKALASVSHPRFSRNGPSYPLVLACDQISYNPT
jgi:hypothetical protein